ncbi:MAG: NAD(P)H-dependent amine dehydrogenase family protein [Candidatus Binatia bacterium]
MRYRVIQWASGNVGRAAVQGIVSHPELELVGAWVHGADKVGRDIGEICGLERLGIAAVGDIEDVLAMPADCVLYSPLLPQLDEVARLLESGKNVVTPVGWFYPFGTPGVAQLEAACRAGGVSLHGTGIHPGGITELLPLTVSRLSRNIRHVRAEEFSDIRVYKAEMVVREVMLFGKPPEVARTSPMLDLLGYGFGQSIDMVATALGLRLDPQKRTSHAMAVATAPIETPVGTLATGTVAAQRFGWQGTVDGTPVITVRVNWLMGEQHLDPPWTIGGERFEIDVEGDPSVQLTLRGLQPPFETADLDRNPGIVATAMHCVNSIPYLCAAPAGIRTYLDLPLITGRADAGLRG